MFAPLGLIVLLVGWMQDAGPAPSPAIEQGRQITTQFLSGKVEPLWAKSGPSLRRQFGSAEGFAGFARKVKRDFGVELQWTWDANGLLVAASVRPAVTESPSPHENTTPKTALRLPIEGAWNVLWGGRTWEDNRHASVADQRFALDLLIWREDGTSEGNGTRNDQYYCWGLPSSRLAAEAKSTPAAPPSKTPSGKTT